jgi:hypothetical protein
MEIGVALDMASSAGEPGGAVALAQRAEDRGLDLVVVLCSGAPGDGLDPWTTVAWLAGATQRIGIGIDAPAISGDAPGPARPHSDPDLPYSTVVAKAYETLSTLAEARIIRDSSAWVMAPQNATIGELTTLAFADLPVVVPVGTAEEVDRLAEILADRDEQYRRGPRRSAAARARRMAGIDYDRVPESLADAAVEPGDPGYRAKSSTYLRAGAPGLVLRARTPEEVADALGFARRHPDVPLGIRSAGHGISGRSTNVGGIVIDVGGMNSIEVIDQSRRLVRIGPGATWKQVAAALAPYGWALGSGDYGGVGVGGLATAGGIGLLSRSHGLTIDHMQAVDLVLADGSRSRASRDENPDLFWAVRGAGANFGIATSFEFEVDEVGSVGWAKLTLISDDMEESLRRFGELASTAPRDTTVFFVTGPPREDPRGQSLSSIQLFAVVDNPDPDVVVERLVPFLELGTLVQQRLVMTPYAGVMDEAADVGPEGQQGFAEPYSRSAFLPELTPDFARAAAAMLRSGSVYFFELRAMGGAIADVPSTDAAFSYRAPAFQLCAMGGSDQRLTRVWEPLREHFDGLYLSFETDRRPERLLDAFPAPVLDRLRELKRRYDPGNLFRDNFNIDPNSSASMLTVAVA